MSEFHPRFHPHGSCHGCHHGVDRRGFLRRCGAAALAAAGPWTSLAARADGLAAEEAAEKAPGNAAGDAGLPSQKARVAVVFLASMDTREIWPYPGFDTKAREREVLSRLQEGCPELELVPVTIEKAADTGKALALKDSVDGYLVYAMTLVWGHHGDLLEIAKLGKPLLIADEFLGGSGVFLTGRGAIADLKIPAAAVSSTRLGDLVNVARQFSGIRSSGVTPAEFARRCERVYRGTFSAASDARCADDSPTLTPVGECVERLRRSRFLIVANGPAGEERDFLGVRGRFVDFAELAALYDAVDPDEAAEWGERWSRRAVPLPSGDYVEPSRPEPEAVRKAGGLYLATRRLLEKYGTDSVTMDCLGGFAAGKLPSYPCLGFMQLLDDGGQGVCEAMPDDSVSMLLARILTARPGFVSDPALDTSRNEIVYAHCVGTTKVFGPEGSSNGFRIRTLHNRDPRGACGESLLPAGYMTTSFRTNVARKELIVHQARALGALESERGCRTKLRAEVRGDIGKLFDGWSRFGWHRVTVYGDVKEPLLEVAKALGLGVVEEA
jgi:hypothetical protein